MTFAGMESKWVLTSNQKKVRFRNLIKKRKSESEKTSTEPSEVDQNEELGVLNDEPNSGEPTLNRRYPGNDSETSSRNEGNSSSDSSMSSFGLGTSKRSKQGTLHNVNLENVAILFVFKSSFIFIFFSNLL